MSRLKRITIDPEICHGKPCIRGSSGMSFDQIIEDRPELEREDILASLDYAKLSLSGRSINEVL
ncbi:DUF433 domain-containing protein [soil metagenome]